MRPVQYQTIFRLARVDMSTRIIPGIHLLSKYPGPLEVRLH